LPFSYLSNLLQDVLVTKLIFKFLYSSIKWVLIDTSKLRKNYSLLTINVTSAPNALKIPANSTAMYPNRIKLLFKY